MVLYTITPLSSGVYNTQTNGHPKDPISPFTIAAFSPDGDTADLLAIEDLSLPVNIITKTAAKSTGHKRTRCPSQPISSSSGVSYLPIGEVQLRWYQPDHGTTLTETFYVVRDEQLKPARHNVIFGKPSNPEGRALFRREENTEISPLGMRVLSPGTYVYSLGELFVQHIL
jgi:hypothetical protein